MTSYKVKLFDEMWWFSNHYLEQEYLLVNMECPIEITFYEATIVPLRYRRN